MASRNRVLRRLSAFCLFVTVGPGALAGQMNPEGTDGGRTRPSVAGTVLTWAASEHRQVATIEGPSGEQIRRVFEPWETVQVDLSDFHELPDGYYAFNVRRVSDSKEVAAFVSVGSLEVESGAVRTGKGASDESPLHVIAQAITDSGSDPRVHLEDTSPNGGGTDDDWVLWADVLGDESFAVFWDPDHSGLFAETSVPFVIEREIDDFALYLQGNGATSFAHIGVNTNTPATTLHLSDHIPGILFESFSGSIEHRWRLDAFDRLLSITDVTHGSTPFVIFDDTPPAQLVLHPAGVGLGTSTPQGNLHVAGGAREDVFAGVGPDLIAGPAFNFGYSGASFGEGSGFFNVRPAAGASSPGPALYFMTRNVERLVVDRDGSLGVDMDASFGNTWDPQHPIESQRSGAHLSSAGVWTNASSRALKDNVRPLQLATALETLAALEPVRFNYLAAPEDDQVGFIAEDVPDLVATPDRKSLAPTDIVGVLARVLQHQQEELDRLRRLGEAQRLQIELFEAALAEAGLLLVRPAESPCSVVSGNRASC